VPRAVVVLALQSSLYALPERMRSFVGMFYGYVDTCTPCGARATVTLMSMQLVAGRIFLLRASFARSHAHAARLHAGRDIACS
jgi:hypothetical protein